MSDEPGLITPPSQDDPAMKPAGSLDGMPNQFADQAIADAQVPHVQPRSPLSPPSPSFFPDPPPSPYDERSDGSGEGRNRLALERQKYSAESADRRSGKDRRLQAAELSKAPLPAEYERAQNNEALLELLDKVDAVREARNAVKNAESNLIRALIADGWTTAKSGPDAQKEVRATIEDMLGWSINDFI